MTKINKIGKLFPSNNSRVAYYDPATFIIYLGTISEQEMEQIKKNPLSANNIDKFKILCHELRHNIDHVATLWGQKNILKHLRALNARMDNDMTKFNSVIEYIIEDRQLLYEKYFTETYNKFPTPLPNQRWTWHISSGLKFDSTGRPDKSKPIPLIHFATYNRIPLTRVPLSVITLLETNAIYEEIKTHSFFFKTLSENQKYVENENYQRELLKLLYNQDLVIYNVAVHVTANLLNISDIIEAFKISSIIATITLNLPSSVVEQMKINDSMLKHWKERSEWMQKNNEYGFIFLNLLDNYKTFYIKDKTFNLEAMLKSSNLPSYEEIQKILQNEFLKIEQEASSYKYLKKVFLPRLNIGKQLNKSLGIGMEKNLSLASAVENNFKPTIICSDTEIDTSNDSYKDIGEINNLSQWYNFSWDAYNKLNDLFDIRSI